MNHFVHERGICESERVGDRTTIWAFAHVLPGAVIGADCNLNDGVFVENDVVIGDRVTLKCGVQIWDGIRLEDDVFVGPNATFTNDRFPRSKQRLDAYPQTVVEHGASIGGNATILPGIRIGSHAMVGAGSVVTRDVPSYAIVAGNPARIIGYADTETIGPIHAAPGSINHAIADGGFGLIELQHAIDLRGSLSAVEFAAGLPFPPKRMFIVYDVPTRYARGAHAHRECHQFLICVKGSVHAIADDGTKRREYLLDAPDIGLYMQPLTWGTQYAYSPDAVLVVLASHEYDNADYIREYDEFLSIVAGAPSAGSQLR